jgi:hypothetical protein
MHILSFIIRCTLSFKIMYFTVIVTIVLIINIRQSFYNYIFVFILNEIACTFFMHLQNIQIIQVYSYYKIIVLL